MLEAIVATLGVALIGVVGWAIQLGSRVSVIEAENEGIKTLINLRFEEVNRRLDRIEEKL